MRRIALRPPQRQRSAQRGQILLVILTMLVIGFGAAFYAFVSPSGAAIERDKITTAALVQAKEALVGWSAQRTSSGALPNARPGELPCPDINNDGFEDGTCVAGAVGRVPWKTLGIPEPKDSAGETLWYAIADRFRIWSLNGTVINSDTKGNITVYLDSTATMLTNQAAAIIFAPGAAMGTQNRSTTDTMTCTAPSGTYARNLCASNYLETAGGTNNATINGPFIQAQTSSTFNDRLLVVTNADIMPVVEQRVARELRKILQDYKTRTACVAACTNLGGTLGCYPWADLSDGRSDAPPLDAVGQGRNRGRVPTLGAAPYDWGANPCGTALPRLPGWISPILPGWFVNNDWRLVVYYSAGKHFLGPGVCPTCVDTTLTVDGVAGKEVVILMPGPLLGASPRTLKALDDPTYWQDYFEDPANKDFANDVYVTPTSTAYTRARIFTIP